MKPDAPFKVVLKGSDFFKFVDVKCRSRGTERMMKKKVGGKLMNLRRTAGELASWSAVLS